MNSKKLISIMLVLMLTMNLMTVNVFAANSNKTEDTDISILKSTNIDEKEVQLVKISNKESDKDTFIVVVSNKETKAKASNSYKMQSTRIDNRNKEIDAKMSLENIIRNDKKSNYSYSNRVEFEIFSSEVNAEETYTKIMTSRSVGFFHGSYIEDYYSWAGHGYHIYLSARDASYITNLGWVASDSIAAGLVAIGAVTGGIGVVLGAIATVAVLTLYWAEQNDDGSLEIWSPDLLRGISVVPGGSLGTAKIGNHWYPIVMPF